MTPVECAASSGDDSLARRAATASVAVPLALVAILALPTAMIAVVLAIVAVGASLEWTRISTPSRIEAYVFAVVVAGSLLFLWALRSQWLGWLVTLCAISLVWWCVALFWVTRFERGQDTKALDGAIARGIVGWLVIVPAWAGLVYLHGTGEDGPWRVLFVFLIVWVADTGAYFAGRRFGGRRLAAVTSPGKTVVGAAVGIAAASMLGLATGLWLGLKTGLCVLFAILCVAVAALSVLGDLMESLAKRRGGVKNSGSLLPGHGGVLDRIDSLTAAAPAFAVGLEILGMPP